jgi:hypothetical protein
MDLPLARATEDRERQAQDALAVAAAAVPPRRVFAQAAGFVYDPVPAEVLCRLCR